MMIREKILVIEDEKSISHFICTVLNNNGYEAMQAQTGEEALSMISSHCPDLVILDLGLPDMDGLDILRKLREWSSLPVVVVSARSHEKDKVTALDLGADDYLTKPFMTKELLARLRALARRNVNISFSLILTSPCFHPHTLCRAHSLWHPRRPPDKPFSSARRTPAFCDRPFRSQ